jgi:hypothetical protein
MIRRMNIQKFIIVSGITLLLSACNNKNAHEVVRINPELIGMWSDDAGCNLTLLQMSQGLILDSFNNAQGVSKSKIKLNIRKESVMTRIIASDSTNNWSAIFSEGLIMVDNNLCKRALHKVDSK